MHGQTGEVMSRTLLQLLLALLACAGADRSFAALCAQHAQVMTEGAGAAHGWKFMAETAGVRTYNRAPSSSSIHEVLAKATIDHPPERLFAVISDYERYPEFMPYVKRSEVVRKQNDVRWVFQHLVFPFPVSDRQYTIKISDVESRPKDGFYCVEWSLDKDAPAKRDVSGITPAFNDGFWILRQLDQGKTEVSYFLHTDPSGWLPAWIINMANREALPAVMQALRQRVEHSNHHGSDPAAR
jgi:ribosome-associated toxin RatA of RatAB toxin-antitoxin module